MVDLFNFDEVDDGHRHVDVHRDVQVVHFVKAEGRNLLVVVVLVFRNFRMSLFSRSNRDRVDLTHLHEKKFAIVFVRFIQTV